MIMIALVVRLVGAADKARGNQRIARPARRRWVGLKIKIIVHEAEEGGFWAEVPAIPGCASEGETLEELLENVHEAVEGCLPQLPYVRLSGGLAIEQQPDQFLPVDTMVPSHLSQDSCQGPDAQRVVSREGDEVLPALRGGQTHVTSCLPGGLVAERVEGAGELLAGDVAR